jgi:hypothetical protein
MCAWGIIRGNERGGERLLINTASRVKIFMNDISNLGEEKVSKSASAQKHHQHAGDVDRLLQEINLLNLERFLFSTDRKRPTKPHSLLTFADSAGNSCTLEIGRFGQPGELSYRVLQAALFQIGLNGRTCSDDVCTFSAEVTFSKRQLARLCGRTWGGWDDADYHRAIMLLHTTRVQMEWYDKATDRTEWKSFYVFANADFVMNGDVRRNPEALKSFERCVLAIDKNVVESFNAGYCRAFNLARLLPLRCNGQMLYKRLFLAFGYLHQKGVKHPRYEKDYEDICRWLNQRPRRYVSEIKRHIATHLDDMVRDGTLRSYDIVLKKSGDGYKLVCYPGPAFYEDYPLFLETAAAVLPMRAPDLTDDEPVELLAYFHERCGRTHGEFRPNEHKQATDHLKRFSLEEGKDLVDFAFEQKAKNVVPQVFGFVLGYLPQWQSLREQRVARRTWRTRIASCPFCDEAGMLQLLTRTEPPRSTVTACPHNREQIERVAKQHGLVVPSLRNPQ